MRVDATDDAELDRLNAALVLVQGDLDRTLRENAPRLQVVVVPGDETDLEQFDRTFRAYVAAVGDVPWGGAEWLWGPTDVEALFEVADGTQDYLIDRERLVWPVCPTHDRGVHVRPAGMARDWAHHQTEGGPLRPGPPAWWCNGGEGHDLDLIGELAQSGRPGPKPKRRQPRGEPMRQFCNE